MKEYEITKFIFNSLNLSKIKRTQKLYWRLTYSCHKFSSLSSSCWTLSGWILERATLRRDSSFRVSVDFCDKSSCNEAIWDFRFFTCRSWASSGASAAETLKKGLMRFLFWHSANTLNIAEFGRCAFPKEPLNVREGGRSEDTVFENHPKCLIWIA